MNKKAYFAAGCFWGVEHLFKQLDGVVLTEVGYMGGTKENPIYEEICEGNTGHFETVEVIYDPELLKYENLVKYFFEIHDFSQEDGQGPDIGYQYLSVIFYSDEEEKETSEKVINTLKEKGYKVATQLRKSSKFWIAEGYHQDYYSKNGETPYCHMWRKIF